VCAHKISHLPKCTVSSKRKKLKDEVCGKGGKRETVCCKRNPTKEENGSHVPLIFPSVCVVCVLRRRLVSPPFLFLCHLVSIERGAELGIPESTVRETNQKLSNLLIYTYLFLRREMQPVRIQVARTL
jgi:hypothetical protein